jgi:P27 family predicted phage terminase small subunit
LRGDSRPSRNPPPIEATIPDEIPTAPAFLNGAALDEWTRVAPELHRLGLLSVLDVAPLAAWCAASARWRRASEALQAMPEAERLFSPLDKICRDAAKQAMAFGAAFGLSPASRQRLSGSVKKAPGKFAGFIGGGEPA